MIGIAGAGAFGTALAIALGRDGREVTLWARDAAQVRAISADRRNLARLPDGVLPDSVAVTDDLVRLGRGRVILLSMPMQSLGAFLGANAAVLAGPALIACCKGIDLRTLKGATALVKDHVPKAAAGILTGPSFAADIARGLPTAMTLAMAEPESAALQGLLSTATLRIYRTSDVLGAELGGALKNVVAIAAGVVIGAGLGDSARAALMTRGFAELQRMALALGARAETLAGLSGFGDLVLTCTSVQSRNLRYGMALGSGAAFEPGVTVEGVATARAVARMAEAMQIEMPVTRMVADLIDGKTGLDQVIRSLMLRPLKQE
jgi:glycerol-3-phosphate dehydrogenase (NAD(P)+)